MYVSHGLYNLTINTNLLDCYNVLMSFIIISVRIKVLQKVMILKRLSFMGKKFSLPPSKKSLKFEGGGTFPPTLKT